MVELLKTQLMEYKKFTLEDELKDQEDFINYQFAENEALGFVREDGPVFVEEIKRESLSGLRGGVQKFKKYWNDDHGFKSDQPIYSYSGGAFVTNGIKFVQEEIFRNIEKNNLAKKTWDHICDVLADDLSRILSHEYHGFLHDKIPLRSYPPKTTIK